jgi:hypothetical protein
VQNRLNLEKYRVSRGMTLKLRAEVVAAIETAPAALRFNAAAKSQKFSNAALLCTVRSVVRLPIVWAPIDEFTSSGR